MRHASGHRPTACLLLAACCSLSFPGCVTAPVPIRAGARAPLPNRLARHYDYTPVSLEPKIHTQESLDGAAKIRLTLTAPDGPSLRSITVDWYRPSRPGRLPAVLISPILAGNDLYVREFARHFAARGMHAVIVYRQKEVFSADRDLGDIEKHLRESIVQMRQTLDWLESQAEVDPERIGSFAISMGAILTVALAAVEPRIRCSVFGLAAGDIPEILMASQDKAIRKRRNNTLRENRLTEPELLSRLEEAIVSEPMDFAPAVDPNRALLIAGLFDRVLGLKRSLALWRALGRPRLILLPTGHYSAVLATPYLKAATYSFLKRALNSSGFTDA